MVLKNKGLTWRNKYLFTKAFFFTLLPPCSAPPPLSGPGGGVTWPMNDKKSTGNHRRRMR